MQTHRNVQECSAGHRLVAEPDVRQVAPRLADGGVQLQRQRAAHGPIFIFEIGDGPRQRLNIYLLSVARHLRVEAVALAAHLVERAMGDEPELIFWGIFLFLYEIVGFCRKLWTFVWND